MDRNILEGLIEQGLSSYEIAPKFGISQSALIYWLKKYSLKTRLGKKSRRNEAFWKEFQNYYDLGNSLAKCCSKFTTSMGAVFHAKSLGKVKTRNRSEAGLQASENETEEQRANRILNVKAALKKTTKSVGGYRPGAGRSKKFKVIDSFGSPVCLQSSYEFLLYQILERNKIKWIRPTFVTYELEGRKCKYFADFFLPDNRLYIDTKNDYLIKIDKKKIEAVKSQNKIKLIVLSKKEISGESILQIIDIDKT